MNISEFKSIIYEHYATSKRSFPWRETSDPYKILVSEIMLQQTQTARVVSKYEEFIEKFPTIEKLASAQVGDVLKLWIGLGYNRRALALKRAVEMVTSEYKGKIPETDEELMSLPGIGPYTAGAILAFAFNKPKAIIETNIRTVYIHFFFPNMVDVDDKDLSPLIEASLDLNNPREWYWALMDYGALLKQGGQNKGLRSKHYRKQGAFKGSGREVRGKILKLLSEHKRLSEARIEQLVDDKKRRVGAKLEELKREAFVVKKGRVFSLA